MRADLEAEYVALVETATPTLRRLARSVTPDHHRADDLVQTTLEKVYLAWPRLTRRGELPMAYARTTLVRTLISEDRRHWRRREALTDELPDQPDRATSPETRVDLASALRRLTPRQRRARLPRRVGARAVFLEVQSQTTNPADLTLDDDEIVDLIRLLLED